MRTILEFKLPESMVAFNPNVPANDQIYPVAAPLVVVAAVKAGAVNLYIFAPQTLGATAVMEIDVGANGGFKTALLSFSDFFGLFPQREV